MTTQPSPQAKVLVVNDDHASLLAITSMLGTLTQDASCEVITAASGYEALRHVLRHDFAVILLDVNMPEMNGFETAEAIRQRPRSADVPIIFITAYRADEIDSLKAYQHGAADFLFTPSFRRCFVPRCRCSSPCNKKMTNCSPKPPN